MPPNSIITWADLEQKFHKYFFAETREMRLSDPISVRQKAGESVHDYVERFRDVGSKYFSLQLTDTQMVEIAFNGLVAPLREKFPSAEFESLSELVQKASI